jgi:hypothetical protein
MLTPLHTPHRLPAKTYRKVKPTSQVLRSARAAHKTNAIRRLHHKSKTIFAVSLHLIRKAAEMFRLSASTPQRLFSWHIVNAICILKTKLQPPQQPLQAAAHLLFENCATVNVRPAVCCFLSVARQIMHAKH